MTNHPTTSPIPPGSPLAAPGALDSFREAGWAISGSPAAWTATRIRGSASRVIAASTAAELLEKLLAAEEQEREGGRA